MVHGQRVVSFENKWRRTVFALDSQKGLALPHSVVTEAQRHERKTARRRIAKAQARAQEAPPHQSEQRPPRRWVAPTPDLSAPPSLSARLPDLFDFLVAQQMRKDPSHDSGIRR